MSLTEKWLLNLTIGCVHFPEFDAVMFSVGGQVSKQFYARETVS